MCPGQRSLSCLMPQAEREASSHTRALHYIALKR